MNDTVSGFLRILFIHLLVITGFGYMLLTLLLLPFPLNCVASSLPFCVTMWFALMEVRRQQRLGFAYHMVREIPQEQMERALREIEKEMKKSKPLP